MTDISGRVALVTGAGSGIGRALAHALAREGCPVHVADIAADRAAPVVEEIRAAGGTAQGIVCDVSDRASVSAMKLEAERTLGLPTLLFANAGVVGFGAVEEMPPSETDWLLMVNLHGPIYCIEAFLPFMLQQGGGHIVATSSMAGMTPLITSRQMPYAAAKAGVIGMMLGLHNDYARRGIGCTVLVPGGVHGRMAESNAVRPARFGGPGEPMKIPAGLAERMSFRDPADVAEMVLRAIRNDRPIVLTDESRRQQFLETYVNHVLQAFDDVQAFSEAEK